MKKRKRQTCVPSPNKEYCASGVLDLMGECIKQARNDYQTLVECGIIEGEDQVMSIEQYAKKKSKGRSSKAKILGYYTSDGLVVELIYFLFHGGIDRLLERINESGLKLDIDYIKERITR